MAKREADAVAKAQSSIMMKFNNFRHHAPFENVERLILAVLSKGTDLFVVFARIAFFVMHGSSPSAQAPG